MNTPTEHGAAIADTNSDVSFNTQAETTTHTPRMQVVYHDYWRAARVRETNMTYWMDRLFDAENKQDLATIRKATDILAEYVMQARADAERKLGEVA